MSGKSLKIPLPSTQGHRTSSTIADFLTLLTVCHTVIPEVRNIMPVTMLEPMMPMMPLSMPMPMSISIVQENDDGSVRYNAASPDERALVEGAELYSCRFCCVVVWCAGMMVTPWCGGVVVTPWCGGGCVVV